MEQFKVGDRVSLSKETLSLSYVLGRLTYTNIYESKTGTVIGYTSDYNKIAIEFDEIVFTRPNGIVSSHDNGCHGKGKKQHCWYFPEHCLIKATDNNLILLL